jgi:hypothetical protein
VRNFGCDLAIERMRCWVESWEGASSEGLLGLRFNVLVIKYIIALSKRYYELWIPKLMSGKMHFEHPIAR